MTGDEGRRYVERGIQLYLGVLLLLTVVAWIPFLRHGGAKDYAPLGSFSERFGDIVHFASTPQRFANQHLEDLQSLAGTLFPRNYGPLAVLAYLFMLKVCSPDAVVVFLGIVGCSLLAGCVLLWRAARKLPAYRPYMAAAIFATGLLAWPTAQTVMRGNIEGLLWIGYAAALGCMFRRNWAASSAVLAVAMCIKPYPALWFVLLAFRKRYMALMLGGLILVAVMVGCFAILGGGNPKLGAARIRGGSTEFFQSYIVGLRDVEETVSDHSLFETAKSATRVIEARGFHLRKQDYGARRTRRLGYVLLGIYVPLAGACLLGVFWKIRRMPFLNQVFSLSICLTLLPLIAGDYTMTILYIPMAFFLLFLLRDVAVGRAAFSPIRMSFILTCCAVLMAPLPAFGIWAGDVRSLVLLSLLPVVMSEPMPMLIDREEASEEQGQFANITV
jgi:hypothetical protein